MNRHRRGVSAVEILVGVMISAAIAVPVLALLFQGRDSGQRARFQYLAILAARDAMYLSRFLVGSGLEPSELNTKLGSYELKGNPTEQFLNLWDGSDPGISEYSEEQARVKVELTLDENSGNERIKLGTVKANWLKGQEAVAGTSDKGRPGTVKLEFGVLKPPVIN